MSDVESNDRQPAEVGSARDDVLFGRDGEIGLLTGLGFGSAVVAADSGVGKSALMKSVSTALHVNDTVVVAIEPTRIANRAGALQAGLFEALAGALADFADADSVLRRWGQVLADAAERAASARARDLAHGAGRFVLGMIQARLGDRAADAVGSVAAQLGEASADRLATRIAAQADPDVLDAFRALAAEVAATTRRDVVLILDGLERLGEDDFRLLCDLVEGMPADVHLITSHSMRSGEDVNRLRRMDMLDVVPERLPLRPLGREHVASWLRREGVLVPDGRNGDLEQVMTATNGYPLYVDSAIALLRRGEALGSLTGPRGFAAALRANYAALGPDEQYSVARLCAFTDPPPQALIYTLLGLTEREWAVQEGRLKEARILVTNVEGRAWFHELGRRSLWTDVIGDRQRALTAGEAFEALLGSSADGYTVQECIDAVGWALTDAGSASERPGVPQVLDASRTQVALLGSLFELSDGEGPAILEVGSIVRHARDRFDALAFLGDDLAASGAESADTDLLAELQQMGERGLVVLVENDHRAVVALSFRSAAAHTLAFGRTASELNRIPVPRLASRVFDSYVRPNADGFVQAQFGVGAPDVTSLSERLREAEWDKSGEVRSHHRRPGLVVRPRLGDLALYAAVNFDSIEQRDQALANLRARTGQDLDATPADTQAGVVVRADAAAHALLFGESLSCDLLEPWPNSGVLAENRFVDAVEYLTGENHRRHSPFNPRTSLPTPNSLREQLELHVRVADVLRSLSSPLERDVLHLGQPSGFVFGEGDRGSIVAELRGSSAVREMQMGDSPFGSRGAADVERRARLGVGETIGRINWSGGRQVQNPVPGLISNTVTLLQAFNRAQGSGTLRVPFNEHELLPLMQEAHERRRRDALALADAGVVGAPGPVKQSTMYVLVTTAQVEGRLFSSFPGTVRTVRIDGTPEHTVRLRILDEDESLRVENGAFDWWDGALHRNYFDMPGAEPVTASASTLTTGLGALLGHDTVMPTTPR